MLWEVHEVNFRCELHALDYAMLGASKTGNDLLEWERADVVARVWDGRGLVGVFPLCPGRPAPDLWAPEEWKARRPHLRALLNVMLH